MTSEAAGLTAWLYVDLDDQANARRHYRIAVKEAQKTGHPLLPAYMQASYGHFAVSSGHPAEGLRLVAEARQNLPRSAPAIAQIWLDSIEAVALAHYKDRRALNVLDNALTRLGKASNEEPVWPWLFRFDTPKLAGFRATAEAKLGRWDEAAASHRTAATTKRSDKQRAVSDVERAYILAAPPRKQVEHACAVAVSAFDAGITYGQVLPTVQNGSCGP